MKTKPKSKPEPSFMEGRFCPGDPQLISANVGDVDYVSPFFATQRHEQRKTDLFWQCARLNLSIHDRHEVDAAMRRGDDMQEFAQGIIQRTSL